MFYIIIIDIKINTIYNDTSMRNIYNQYILYEIEEL